MDRRGKPNSIIGAELLISAWGADQWEFPGDLYTIFIALEGFETALKDFERVSGNE